MIWWRLSHRFAANKLQQMVSSPSKRYVWKLRSFFVKCIDRDGWQRVRYVECLHAFERGSLPIFERKNSNDIWQWLNAFVIPEVILLPVSSATVILAHDDVDSFDTWRDFAPCSLFSRLIRESRARFSKTSIKWALLQASQSWTLHSTPTVSLLTRDRFQGKWLKWKSIYRIHRQTTRTRGHHWNLARWLYWRLWTCDQ